MVAKGLPDAVQRAILDATGYDEGAAKIIQDSLEMVNAVKKSDQAFKDLATDLRSIRRDMQDLGAAREFIRNFVELEKAVDAAHEANKRFNDNPTEIQDHTHLIAEATKAYQDHAGATDFLRQATTRYIEETVRADDSVDTHIQTTNELTAATQKAAQARRDLAAAHREVTAAIVGARAIGGGDVSGGLRMIRTSNLPSGGTAFADTGGGGGGAGAFLGAAAAGAGGFIGRTGSAIAGGFDKGPTAGQTFDNVAAFARRWYPAAHWALMLTNEMLATVGPAVVAASMGALVGMQGVEQVAPRVSAIFKTAESIGNTMGVTAGQYMGLKTGFLQGAQNLATGATPELLGAGINIMKAGAGGPFVQLGSNTVAMVDRFAATLTQDFQKGGLGQKLGNIVGGGTGYLQQFGDVAANLGNAFVNMAPNLPGVGGDLLGILTGGTGVLASGTKWLGGMLGPLLAGEAGLRWGPGIVGGAGRGIARFGNILGDVGKGGLLSKIGLGTGTEGGLAGVGSALAGLSAPEIAALAAGAFTLSKGYTYQNPMQQQMNSLLAGVNQQGLAQGLGGPQGVLAAMQRAAGVSPSDNRGAGWVQNMAQGFGGIFGGIGRLKPSEIWHGVTQEVHGGWQAFGGMGRDPGNFSVAQQALQSLSETMVNSLGAGKQIQTLWKGLSGDTVGMGKAFDIATMAQLQLGSAFEKNGKLTGQAKTMIGNLYAGYAPMNMNTGMFGAAVGAQTAMSGLQHTQVQAVNQSYDQLMQLVTGGAAGSANIFGMLGGTPTTRTRGGLRMAAGPGIQAMAHALTSFTTAQGAGAWNTFANPQTGMMSALQGQLDWLRNAQTMGALGPGQTTGMAGFLTSQFLPIARQSPGALAALSMAAQQFGGPAFAPGTSAAAMFKGLSQWVQQRGMGAGGYNAAMNLGMQHMGNIPLDAQQFTQQIGSGLASSMAQGVATRGAGLQDAFMSSITRGGFSAAALSKYAQFMHGAGAPTAGIQDMAAYAAKLMGAGAGMQQKIKLSIQADLSGINEAQAKINALRSKAIQLQVHTNAALAQAQINSIKGHQVNVPVGSRGIPQVQAAINGIKGKAVTVTVTERLITIGHLAVQPGGSTFGYSSVGAGGQYTAYPTKAMQTGGMVPGSGRGDIIPAMLEPGEAIIPRYLVPLIAPILAAHHVPGFGGIPQSRSSHFAAGGMAMIPPFGLAPHVLGFPDPATLQGKAGQFAFTLIDGITKALNATGAKKIAQALIAKISQEVALAKNVSSAAMLGQGFGNSGLFGMFTPPPAGTGGAGAAGPGTKGFNAASWNAAVAAFAADTPPAQTVQQQMQSYLHSVQSFSKDIGQLRKQHLNKDVIAQLIGAGPVQGDLFAQSIMGTGVGGINRLWGRLGTATRGLGAQAAMAQYGGFVAPNLKSASATTNHVTININAPAGHGSLDLTTAQINQIVAAVQAALLKQGRRNNKVGLQLAGKGA